MIATKGRGVGEKKVRNQDRLRASQMRERRHQCGAARLSLPGQDRRELNNRSVNVWNSTLQIEAQVERDLLVSRSSGMQASSRVADTRHQLTLDERMYILVVLCRIGSEERRIRRSGRANLLEGT